MTQKDLPRKAIAFMILVVLAMVAFAAYSTLRPARHLRDCSQYAAGEIDGVDCTKEQ
ncbi:hypothetical protein KC957_00440 [Candidatus Saccharibacteria bacterium]|nr:hypothetical protein [Candidatus Saccharibacteria bacterium]